MMKGFKRVLSTLLAVALVVSLLPYTVLASGSDFETSVVLEQVAGKDNSVSVVWKLKTLNGIEVCSISGLAFKFDNTIYDLVTLGTEGAAKVVTPAGMSTNLTSNRNYMLSDRRTQDIAVFDADTFWTTKGIYAQTVGNYTFVYYQMEGAGDMSTWYDNTTDFVKVNLQLKEGTVADGIVKDSVAIATKDEIASLGLGAAMWFTEIVYDDNWNPIDNITYKYRAKDGADTLILNPEPVVLLGNGLSEKGEGPTTTPLTADMFAVADAAYTGSAITPAVTTTLVAGTDYDVVFANNTYVGTATATFTGKGAYEGTVEKTFAINAIAQAPVVTDKAEIVGTGSIDLATLVTGAQGDVTFAIKSGAEFATLEGATLTGKDVDGTVVVNVAVAAKDVNGDGVAEYAAYAEELVINVTTKTTFSKMAYADYEYKVDNGTLYVKGADATIFVIEATYDGNKMTSCKLTPVVITGGVGSCAVSGNFFIWDANMQAMN